MATSAALPAFGTLFQRGNGASPEVFTTIAEVSSITGPSFTPKIDDVTTHSSSVPWRQKLATLLDGGQLTFQIHYIPTNATHNAGATGLLGDLGNRAQRNFKLVFPDAAATAWIFTGYVAGFKINAAVDGVLLADITIDVSGAPQLV